jgi:hypothetical protein
MDQSPALLRLNRLLTIPVLAVQLWSCGCGAGSNTHTGPPPTQHSVSLSWNASTSSVIGYNIYRGTKHSGPYPQKLTSTPQSATTFTDSTVKSGTTYYYVVTAVNSSLQESDYSNEAQAVIPSP